MPTTLPGPSLPNPASMSIVEVPPDAAESTVWTTGTIVYRDRMGCVVGFGHFERLKDETAELFVTFDASAVSLLAASPQ
jgi:hypothetical protein